jgi:hypothetical protein
LFSGWVHADGGPVTYPRTQPGPEDSQSFVPQLLELVLQRAGWPTPPQPSHEPFLQGRAIAQLMQKQDLRILWTMTSRDRELRLRPIRIPIDWGLLGWRVALVRKAQADVLASVRSLEDLAQFRAVQGHDWPDLAVLRGNGLRVDSGTARDVRFSNLFQMLQLGRVDYFPRAIWEAPGEIASAERSDLVVDRHLLLMYPSALYFFVHPDDKVLAEAVELGLKRALKDGSYEALFKRYNCRSLKALKISERYLIRLRNDALPPETPLGRAEYWLRPTAVSAWRC